MEETIMVDTSRTSAPEPRGPGDVYGRIVGALQAAGTRLERLTLEDLAIGFDDVVVEDTGKKYLAAYARMMELAARGALPPLGPHLLMGATAPAKLRNAARNIEERRTRPIDTACRKPGP
jgi:hypothetical protein